MGEREVQREREREREKQGESERYVHIERGRERETERERERRREREVEERRKSLSGWVSEWADASQCVGTHACLTWALFPHRTHQAWLRRAIPNFGPV